MAETTAALDRVAESMREPVRAFADLVRELGGENALALTLYGAVVAGAFDRDRHTARSVLVLRKVDLDLLKQLAEHGNRLGKDRITAPLIMTPDYIKASLDAFPLEMIEIHQQHATLFGDDHFAELSVDDADVRLQCEREFKTILISLRQGLLASAGREKELGMYRAEVAERLIRTLRGVLWHRGGREPKPAEQVVLAAEKIAECPLQGVRSAISPGNAGGWESFRALYADVETLGKLVDAW